MSTSPAYRATADPHDLISFSIHKLTTFQTLIAQKHPADSVTIGWFGALASDLSLALYKLEVSK